MKSEKEENIKDPYRRTILVSSAILFLLGLWVLIVNIAGVLALDFHSIVMAIGAISMIIGAIEVIKRRMWGLCFLGFSILLPIIVFLLKDPNALYTSIFFEIINLVIFIHLFMLLQAYHCKDESKREKLNRLSRKYIFYILMMFLIIILIIIFNILACAFGGSKVSGITKILSLNGAVNEVRAIGGINVSQ